MFKSDHHNKIITILKSLRSDFFNEISAYFGGGTLLTLLYGEYRWSKDIDFLCPAGDGYRMLRSEIYDKNYKTVFNDFSSITVPREIKADQYGVRFVVRVEDIPIKFEIAAEAGISFQTAEYHEWSDIPCLSFADSCSEKLLSNSDRWADRSVESKDMIDLSMLRLQSEIPNTSVKKAGSAYPVIKPLEKSIRVFQSEADYRTSCFSSLQVQDRAKVIDGNEVFDFHQRFMATGDMRNP